MNQKLALNVVAYIADHLGNLPDDSISEFENYTNDEIDAVVKHLAEIGVINIAQSRAYSYCGIGNEKATMIMMSIIRQEPLSQRDCN